MSIEGILTSEDFGGRWWRATKTGGNSRRSPPVAAVVEFTRVEVAGRVSFHRSDDAVLLLKLSSDLRVRFTSVRSAAGRVARGVVTVLQEEEKRQSV